MKKLTLTTAIFAIFGAQLSLAEGFEKESKESKRKRNYYVKSISYSSNPESDPPRYVNQLDQSGIEAFKNIDWIDAGLSHRIRYEHRDNDFRRSIDNTDDAFLRRTQAYFGIKNILDPLRFAVELQDSRIDNSKFPKNTGDVNTLDVLQAYGELYFKDPIILDRPISLRAGRMAFEVLDRKLLARDDWGNTSTNFQGFRTIIGKKENDWQLDSFALQPMVKSTNESDHANKNQWVYATILNWRKWSDKFTLQPFYFILDQDKSSTSYRRKINSPGMRIFGSFGNSKFDYDLIGIYQFGESNYKTHRANASSVEIGYSYEHRWNPRFSMVYAYASGDKNPNDSKNQRFDKFYGFNRSFSNSNTIEWENLETIKSRVEFSPQKKLRLEASYSYYWLASASDSWRRGNNLRDTSGSNGKEIGHDFDFRNHYDITKNISTTLGYAHFEPGKFTKNVGRNGASDFIYLELNFSLFGWGNYPQDF